MKQTNKYGFIFALSIYFPFKFQKIKLKLALFDEFVQLLIIMRRSLNARFKDLQEFMTPGAIYFFQASSVE